MILTRERYERAIDIYHRHEKARLLHRFDVGAKTHGNWDLNDGRDLMKERSEELLDARAYEIADLVKTGLINPDRK